MQRTYFIRAFYAAMLTFALSLGLPIIAGAAQVPGGQTAAPANAIDNQLAQNVRQALEQAGFGNEPIMVEVHGNTVTLVGTVMGRDRISACEQVARRVDGVEHVDNRLTSSSIYDSGGM